MWLTRFLTIAFLFLACSSALAAGKTTSDHRKKGAFGIDVGLNLASTTVSVFLPTRRFELGIALHQFSNSESDLSPIEPLFLWTKEESAFVGEAFVRWFPLNSLGMTVGIGQQKTVVKSKSSDLMTGASEENTITLSSGVVSAGVGIHWILDLGVSFGFDVEKILPLSGKVKSSDLRTSGLTEAEITQLTGEYGMYTAKLLKKELLRSSVRIGYVF
jgi:hypothetical protein